MDRKRTASYTAGMQTERQPLDFHFVTDTIAVGSMPIVGINYGRVGFDVLVLCAEEYQPEAKEFPGMTIIRVRIQDGKMDAITTVLVHEAVDEITRRAKKGSRVLITCMQGRNRSALVAALVLKKLTGRPGWYCFNVIRARRKSETGMVLANQSFADYLRTLP